MFRSFIILLTFLYSAPAFSDSPGQFSTLSENEPAPFEGVIFDVQAMAALLAGAETAAAECDIEIEYRIDQQATAFQLERSELNLRLESLNSEHTLLITQKDFEIAQLQKTIRTQSPRNNWVWAATGVVLGGLSAYAITNGR